MSTRKVRICLGAGLLTLAAVAGIYTFPGEASSKGNSVELRTTFDDRRSDYTPTTVGTFNDFAAYWLGTDFEGLPLTLIVRRDDSLLRTNPALPKEPVTANYVAFLYGDCIALSHSGCPFPFEVQIWPACERYASVYPDWLPRTKTTARAVPAAFFEDGRRLELYTGSVTVVMFGANREQLLRAAARLEPANALARATTALPAPVPGALDGTVTC
ncbi:MAG: hypothetical protein M3321_04365 [Actinomycetota bacterium]|nr:hypothetical protein [Actinomycetota bacterium]